MIIRRHGKSHKCGCEFGINFSRRNHLEIRITNAKYKHTNGCIPSADSLVASQKKSGYYTRLNKMELRSIYYHLTSGLPVSTSQLRMTLSKILPSRARLTSKDIWNIRVSAKRFRNSIHSQESFDKDIVPIIESISKSYNHNSLDNQLTDLVDQSVLESKKLFEETLRESIDHHYSRFMVGRFMAKLKSVDPSFKYKVFRSSDGSPTGYVYQTSQMRSDFELYGNFISIDMMMRQMNNLKWPYFGPLILDGNNKVRVIGEACLLGEYHEAYKVVLETLLEFTPNRKNTSIQIIAADCAVTEDFMNQINLPNAKLIWDRYHLINHVWKRKLPQSYNKIKPYLNSMLDSISEENDGQQKNTGKDGR